ncbi:SpaA isopeptide-forming pilin-related protein, partial [Gallintestinimicrobium sp.]
KGLTGRFEKVNKSAALMTDDNGEIFVSGLAKGTYYLVETKTKDGYNLLKAPVEVKIETSYSLTSTTKTETKDGKTTTTTTITNGTTDAGVFTTVVKNSKGFTLPTTGGIGTFVFTFAGIAMMAAAVILLITGKKKKAE